MHVFPSFLPEEIIHNVLNFYTIFPKQYKYFINFILMMLTCSQYVTWWKILREMGIPDHLACLLRNLYAGQEATVRTGHGKTDWFQIGKGVCQGCISSPCLFNLYAEYIMRNAGLGRNTSWNQDCREKYQ